MKKYLKYLNYVIRHKWYVFVECCRVSKDLKYRAKLLWLGIIHDWSKFRPSEFIPYARYFYGDYLPYSKYIQRPYYRGFYKEDIDRRFDTAWLYHIHRNKHHWQYWLLQEDDGPQKIIPMPIKYMNEMIADWHDAGMAINGKNNTAEWYLENKDKIKLGRISRKWIERKLEIPNRTTAAK